MSLRDSGLGDARPALGRLAGLAVLVALLGAIWLFVVDRRGGETEAIASGRRLADSASAFAGSIFSAPVGWISRGGDGVGNYLFAASQNASLKRQVAAERAWRDRFAALEHENARLRALLGVRTAPPMPMVFAHTVIDARGPFNNTRLADAGAARGIVEGNPVLSDRGLVGRVTGVAAGVSRIMLLTDVESRTPVLIARTNGRAILQGDGGPDPALTYLRTHDAPRAGDRVLTSGDGGVLPRGLPVGAVVSGLDGAWRVALDSNTTPIDDVRILLFKDFSQLAPGQSLAPRTLPSTATGPPMAPVPAPRVATAGPTP